MPITRSKEGRCTVGLVCPAIGWSDGNHIRRSVGQPFAVFHAFDAHSGEDVDGPIVAHVCFVRGCVPCQRHRVLQSAEPKEAIVQRESLEFMSHEATERRLATSG
jgi:hypothetical protein